MIHEAKEELTEMGFEEVRQFEDSYGTTGYGLRFMGDDYILVAKEYAHANLASFLASFVLNGAEAVDFIFYNNSTAQFTVFDGEYLKEHGEKSSGPSKKRDCSWREIPLENGAELHAYIAGEEKPATLSGQNQELEKFL